MGPSAETREHLGGFYLIEGNLDEAIVTRPTPGGALGQFEIRIDRNSPTADSQIQPEPKARVRIQFLRCTAIRQNLLGSG
jgi:hypothetical protein